MNGYNHRDIESTWQQKWAAEGLYKTPDQEPGKDNYYLLTEFSYPSGNLHVGHWYAFAVSDIFARYKRMNGYNVLFPMGFDSFGLPAENAAIKRGLDPRKWTYENMDHMRKQLDSMGAMFDWDRGFATSDPDYYKWTQWMFAEFFKNDLAYRATTKVNWCESCKTVLANEQVVDGHCERCGHETEQRDQEQWMLRITKYADQLHDDLDQLDWPEEIKVAQKAWIGRSEGAVINFQVAGTDKEIEIFTTRPDTLFGATYMVLAPEHTLVAELLDRATNRDAVEQYVADTMKKSELERQQDKNKTGVPLEGVMAINPANGSEIPVWVADYVLANYGTGAIMAVPAHDERDYEFAEKFGLPIQHVVENPEQRTKHFIFDFDGVLADTFDVSNEAKAAMGLYKDLDEAVRTTIEYGSNPPPHGKDADEETVKSSAEWTELFKKAMMDRRDDLKLFEDFIEEILKIENMQMAIVSSGSITYINHMLQDTPLSPTHVLALEDHHSKEEKVKQICKDWGISEQEAYYFTDTKIDVYELENFMNRSKIIGCAWGYLGADTLREVLPEEQILHNFADIHNIVDHGNIYIGDGKLINSGEFTGLENGEAKQKITEHVGGEMKKTYRLRDWGISRQRYWGCPIPIVYDPQGQPHAIPTEHLPWELPDDVDYTPDGTAPLARSAELKKRTEEIFGEGWTPEYETMDTFLDSSWYFYRYLDPNNENEFCARNKQENWMPINLYMGGAEHTTMHLLYSRFWNKALHDLGHVTVNEPYAVRKNRGLILGPDGNKMSKSKGNVIDPDEQVERVGADTVRAYLAFLGPYGTTANFPWNPDGVVGIRRFLERVWRLSEKLTESDRLENLLHKTIKGVTEDMERYKFNTAISKMMVFTNEAEKSGISARSFKVLLQLLAPIVPHISEELWSQHEKESIHLTDWPAYDATLVVDETISLGVQVNGKVRATVEIAPDASEDEARELALDNADIQKWLDGNEPKKFIYVPGRIISIVV